ncbi:MAG: RNA polymerase sigma factor [Planctomycetes bacterium]|nr:RNA polymerase sigma factor [Planctomycetota bacterium]
MREDRFLISELRQGSSEALCRVYEKYRDDLLRLAVSLSNDTAVAEDIVHDVLVSFIRQSRQFELTGSLKSYLATCVANRARNVNRAGRIRRATSLDEAGNAVAESWRPDQWLVCSEELRQIAGALALLPGEQREAITLHLQGGMKFREIAEFQHVPLKTALSRYRGGLLKLRSLLNSEVSECDR